MRQTELDSPPAGLSVVPAAAEAAQPDSRFDFEAIYGEYLPLMIGLAVGRFKIPQSDAETLAHEVFLDFLLKSVRVTDVRAWLVGSMCNASRYYGRVRSRSESLPHTIAETADPRFSRVVDAWPDQLAARQAFSCTTPRCQLVLRLRYFEEYTVPEVAAELGITARYATKLIGECLRQAERRYTKKARGAQS